MTILWGALFVFLAGGCVVDFSPRSDPLHDGGNDGGGDGRVDGGAPVDGRTDGSGSGPNPPLAVAIPAVEGICPAAFVNAATVHDVPVVVQLGPTSNADDVVWVTVADGESAVEGHVSASAGAGEVTVMLDVVGLQDGPLMISAQAADAEGNRSATVMTDGRKDTEIGLQVDPVVTPTHDTQQIITGRTEPQATVTVRNTTTMDQNDVVAEGDGFFAAALTLADGANAVTVTTVDEAANTVQKDTDSFSMPLEIMLDPNVSLLVLSDETTARFSPGIPTDCSEGKISLAFIDDDMFPDLFITGCGWIYLNDGGGYFTGLDIGEMGERAGVWGDFDNDGDQDVIVTASMYAPVHRLRLYQNTLVESGAVGLVETSIAMGTADNPEGVAWLDYDGDGWLDVFVQDGPVNRLLVNDGSGSQLSEISSQVGLVHNLSNGHSVAACDFDRDGDVDVAVGDEEGFFLVNENGFFSDETTALGIEIEDTNDLKRDLVFGDLNNDGFFDLFVPSGHPGGLQNSLYLYDGVSTYDNIAAAVNLDTPRGIDGGALGDLNNDGRLDIVFFVSVRADLLVVAFNRGDADNDGNPEFELSHFSPPSEWNALDSDQILLADVDRDGDLDVLLSAEYETPRLLLNRLNHPGQPRRQNRRFLKVILQGKGPNAGGANRSALGSVVTLRDCTTGALLGVREVNGGRGNCGQDSPVLFFGGVFPSRCVRIEAAFLGGGNTAEEVRPIEAPQGVVVIAEP